MPPGISNGAHSAVVNIRLLVNGDCLSVAQMGPDCLFIDKPIDHEQSEATIVLNVDKTERRWKVWLPNGISAKSERVPIAAITKQPV